MDDRTPPIEVLAADVEHLRAVLSGREVFEERFGLSVEDGLDVFPGALEHCLATLENGEADPVWGPHLFVDRDRRRVVGFGGYKGPPNQGVVEIGYALAPPARGRGMATGAVRQLVRVARQRGATTCIAHTLPEPNASTAVLARCGFARVGEVVDPEDGRVWRWELPLV